MTDELSRAIARRRAILGPGAGEPPVEDLAPVAAGSVVPDDAAAVVKPGRGAEGAIAGAGADPTGGAARGGPGTDDAEPRDSGAPGPDPTPSLRSDATPTSRRRTAPPKGRAAPGVAGASEAARGSRAVPGVRESQADGGAGGQAAPAPGPGRAAKGRPDRAAGAAAPPATEPRRGRRRFSLPPLDEDHERVSRSIESFLGGVDAPDTVADPGAAGPPGSVVPGGPSGRFPGEPVAPREPAAAGEPAAGPVTVAVVAVEGIPEHHADDRSSGRPMDDAAEGAGTSDDPVGEALAMVERTLRGAARGTDVVTTAERGRFRIVLASTGELAARAYLRRVRATIEPHLQATEQPLRLTMVTATALDEPVEEAVRRAEHRMSSALGDRDAADVGASPVPPAAGPSSREPAGRPNAAADGAGRPA